MWDRACAGGGRRGALAAAAAAAWGAEGLRRSAARCGAGPPRGRRGIFAPGLRRVRVDGRRNVREVLADLERGSEGHTRAVELVALGQPGIAAAFHAAASLRSTARAPAFELADASTAAQLVARCRAAEGGAAEDPAADAGKVASHGKVYHLALPPADEWQPEVKRRIEMRLRVGNHTRIVGLAKALAAQSAPLQEGQGVAVETALLGEEKMRRLRIATMAQAITRAYHWQVLPNDASRPTRPFRCVAELLREEADASPPGGADNCFVLSVEVLPLGPPKLRVAVAPGETSNP